MPGNQDIQFMKKALQLAAKGIGQVSPNPLVGAVLVKDNRMIGTGYHAHYGQAHAEVRALEAATTDVKSAVLYCNLEPCVHTKKQTPPCAQRLIREGIKKVVIASLDPNPQVQGKGVALLRQSGVEVQTGLLAAENEELNRFYFKYITRHLPYVTIKIAQTLDGIIAAPPASRKWITSLPSRQMVHRWRAAFDAVLVGGNTVRIDNPELTVHGEKGRNPVRIIIDGKLKLNPAFKVFRNDINSRTILICNAAAYHKNKPKIFAGLDCTIIPAVADRHGQIPVKKILKILAREKIMSVLVEGGQKIFTQFVQCDIIDELLVFIAPQIWGKGLPVFAANPLKQTHNWRLHDLRSVAEDLLLIYRRY
jgi:diaminohydroxyphosphoribosylaminopyrimidine deaminase/5-amino-6-(5-phosphoribosylamino)uracil reductase